MEKTKSMIIIEDHSIVLNGLVDYFHNKEGYKIAGTAGSVDDAKELLNHTRSDIIILDLQLKDGLSFPLISQIHASFEVKPIIAVYTAFGDFVHVSAAIGKGVDVYMHKYRSVEELEQAINKALNGEKYIDDFVQLSIKINSDFEDVLTRREKEIFLMVKNKDSNKQIAESLGIKVRTVENILQCVFDKLGIHSRSELMEI